jgi:hypothetical protein
VISTLIRYVITFGFVGGIFACDEIVDRIGSGGFVAYLLLGGYFVAKMNGVELGG